jgi:hypothetical protein
MNRITHAGIPIVRYSRSGLWYVLDLYGYRTLRAAKRRAEREAARQPLFEQPPLEQRSML